MAAINYVQIIHYFYPDTQCYAVGSSYNDIVWQTAAIPQGTLDQKHLEYVKWEAGEYIKSLARIQRDTVYSKVLGTDDPNLVRVYEAKEAQARYYVDCIDNSITPEASKIYILESEAAGLGVSNEYLANAIIFQANHAQQQIFPMIGQIEGIRRGIQFMIDNAETDDAVIALRNAPITWPDMSSLVII